ncbi:MAG: hypothetical protein B6I28_00140 [Fusobacteriia bacterium 4572_132]|nr:MAG: hypothetical protein B6I28_00140 [Fusobacteriia bacterium 4572_132]
MSKKSSILILMILMLSVSIFGEEGKYVRKSITAVDSVWVKPGAIAEGDTFDYKFLDEMLDFYVRGINTQNKEVESRFDFNELPKKMTKEFRDQANSLEMVDSKILSKLLEDTVGKEILKILNSDEVKKIRIENLKSETDLETFAASKGKAKSATFEEMKILMNSAYIYLPYITSVKKKIKGKDVSYKINGGIIWYSVKISKDGNVIINKLISEQTFAVGSAEIGAKNSDGELIYDEFIFGNNSYKVKEAQYAQYSAILALAKNLGVKTKQIDDFKLKSQIMEVKSQKEYSVSVGKKEGLFLDDAFDLIEQEEDENGNVINKKVGFVRISKTGDNRENKTNYSTVKQYLGSSQTEGTLITEHPFLGVDLKIKGIYAMGLNIKKSDINFILNKMSNNSYNIITKDADKATGVQGSFAYNLAPITGVSQMFLNIDMSYMLPNLETYTDDKPSIYMYSGYLGLSRKFWIGRFNLNAGLGLGVDALSFKYDYEESYYDYSYEIDLLAYGAKADLGAEFLASPNLMLNLDCSYKATTKPKKAKTTYTSGDFSSEQDYTLTGFESTLGGMTIGVGFTYSLEALPFDIFGFLDPLKRY